MIRDEGIQARELEGGGTPKRVGSKYYAAGTYGIPNYDTVLVDVIVLREVSKQMRNEECPKMQVQRSRKKCPMIS